MGKISAIVILFNPDFSIVDNVKSFYSQVDYVYLWQNSVISAELISELNRIYPEKLKWCGDCTNHGIGYALNQVLAFAKSVGSDWLLTMDQDSCFATDSARILIDSIKYQASDTAIVAANHVVNNKPVHIDNEKYEWVMMSGNLINIDISLRCGGFNELLFIDGVDIEFCRRLICHGFKLTICFSALLNHKLGDVSPVSILGYHTNTTNHNAVRLYYIFRNYLFMIFKLDSSKGIRLVLSKFLLHKILCVLFAEKNKLSKFRMMFMGVIHFVFGKLGVLI